MPNRETPQSVLESGVFVYVLVAYQIYFGGFAINMQANTALYRDLRPVNGKGLDCPRKAKAWTVWLPSGSVAY